jgi:uncharacterized small protein (DUF1192 family)
VSVHVECQQEIVRLKEQLLGLLLLSVSTVSSLEQRIAGLEQILCAIQAELARILAAPSREPKKEE